MQRELFRVVHTGRILGLLLLSIGFASAATTGTTGTVGTAFQTARAAVGPEVQTKVVSVYGLGTPTAIQKWYVIFYDPTVSSHGRAVLVQNNQIAKSYDARGGTTYSSALTFDPSRITDEQPALQAAQEYAAKHAIAYDSVRALLKITSATKPFRWRIELMKGTRSRGFVLVNALDDSVALFVPPSDKETAVTTTPTKTDSNDDEGDGFAHDVKKTFLGIGGDLQQFFTGERTVDK